MKYYYCERDYTGQKTGQYSCVDLKKKEVEIRNGHKYYKGIFLYKSEYECSLSAMY